MRGRVVMANIDAFVVKLGDNLYSIIDLPPITTIHDIYKEADVEVSDEIQGELLTEGSVELLNITRKKALNVVIRKSQATKYDLAAFL
ncbi:MAG: hypothetical protein IJ587_06085, partial [Synergistaceae bacterium]|nr:hypothetical protein [Synergistaceae bacterium]